MVEDKKTAKPKTAQEKPKKLAQAKASPEAPAVKAPAVKARVVETPAVKPKTKTKPGPIKSDSKAKTAAKPKAPARKLEEKPVKQAKPEEPVKAKTTLDDKPDAGKPPVSDEKQSEPVDEKPAEPVKKEHKKWSPPVEKISNYGPRKLSAAEANILENLSIEKKKKPRFVRQELTIRKRLDDKWRRPRGIDSKQGLGKRGKGRSPLIGFKKSEKIRGMHPSGYYPILVANIPELDNVKPETEAAILSSKLGRRKRNEIIKLANEKKITILNPRKGEI